MNRRSMLKALAVVPAAALTGPSGVAALARPSRGHHGRS